jgi:ribosome biogenesis GTPase
VLSEISLLAELGWSPYWEALFEAHVRDDIEPGRIIRSDRDSSLVGTVHGFMRAKPSTRFLKATQDAADFPVVGDWVTVVSSNDLDVLLIEAVLERKGVVSRGDPGGTSGTQVLVANIDAVFVVHPIAGPANLRRIERELSLAWESGAIPIVVLTKADLSPDPASTLASVEEVAFGVAVHMVNAKSSEDVEQLYEYIPEHSTAVLIGPSGAGKSTLINSLVGDQCLVTNAVREGDGKGRHTTVAREIVRVPGHGVIIDTPGLRAVGLTGSDEGIALVFPDIEKFAGSCRFRDCGHNAEPGCAVAGAIESGGLSQERLDSYQKLVREAEVAAAKSNARLRAGEKGRGKALSKAIREYYKGTDRN